MNWLFVLVFVCLAIFSAFTVDLMLRIRKDLEILVKSKKRATS